MAKFCMPKFPGRVVGPVRFSSHGLGNLMLIWGRAAVYARKHGHTLISPRWSQIHVGAWLRWERDKRMYGHLFRKSTHGAGPRRLTSAHIFRESEATQFEADTCTSAILRFEGIEPGFPPLLGQHEQLWKALCVMAREDLEAVRNTARDYVGFGIRLGDFKMLGWATPVSWFEARLAELRKKMPLQRVWLFSDGTDEELRGLLSDPLVSRAPERRELLGSSALAKIAQMSGTKAMIVTGGSSFNRWGVFLGAVPALVHASGEMHMPIWSGLSSVSSTLVGGAKPSDADWERILAARNA